MRFWRRWRRARSSSACGFPPRRAIVIFSGRSPICRTRHCANVTATDPHPMQAWLLLVAAIVLEVAGTTSMKLSQGFERTLPSIMIFVFYSLSFVAMTLALRRLDLSIAYAIWAGVGTLLITLIGLIYFTEQATLFKAACLALIVLGVVGLSYA